MADASPRGAPGLGPARRRSRWRLAALAAAAALGWAAPPALAGSPPAPVPVVSASELPTEARQTLALIKQGGPFRHAKDGSVFGNYERALPRRAHGYYTEYTVRTPGSRNRGPRRIVAGKGTTGDPATSGEYYYTADHYRSFARIEERDR
jgi:ribonuclease T1